MEANENDDPDDIAEIFKIECNLFDFETPLCKAFNEFNYLLKIDTDLFTFDIQGIKTYEEYELNNNMTGDLEEPWSDNGDHKWYDELTDGKLKEEALMHKAKIEESWGMQLPEDYGSDNAGNIQDTMKEYHNPSTCKIRRFGMMKYSFDADDYQNRRDLPRDIPLDSVEVLRRSDTYAGNPIKEILPNLNLPDHRSVLTELEGWSRPAGPIRSVGASLDSIIRALSTGMSGDFSRLHLGFEK
ncbi:hypothetical protein Tco_0992799 [Tanacetum coccineum]|uniref:Uncharacterized protein n=1 Tax=Tanacetum coccineum TaxID=301880 RepID=A0ABQ5F3C5_9ASTR